MAMIMKALGGNITTATTAVLYSASTGKSAMFNTIRILNKDTSNQSPSMSLMVDYSGTNYLIYDAKFKLNAGQEILIEDIVTLGPTDQLKLSTIVNGNLSWIINGMEKD